MLVEEALHLISEILAPHHLAITLQRPMADLHQKVQTWTPAEVQETSAFNSLPPSTPQLYLYFERS